MKPKLPAKAPKFVEQLAEYLRENFPDEKPFSMNDIVYPGKTTKEICCGLQGLERRIIISRTGKSIVNRYRRASPEFLVGSGLPVAYKAGSQATMERRTVLADKEQEQTECAIRLQAVLDNIARRNQHHA